MKKKQGFTILLLLFLGLTACQITPVETKLTDQKEETSNFSVEKSPYQELPSEYEGMTMEIEQPIISESAESFKITMLNKGDSIHSFSSYYTIERKEGGQWYLVPFKERAAFQDDAPSLGPSQQVEHIIPVNYLEPKFQAGDYRLVKLFESDETREQFALAIPFTVQK